MDEDNEFPQIARNLIEQATGVLDGLSRDATKKAERIEKTNQGLEVKSDAYGLRLRATVLARGAQGLRDLIERTKLELERAADESERLRKAGAERKQG